MPTMLTLSRSEAIAADRSTPVSFRDAPPAGSPAAAPIEFSCPACPHDWEAHGRVGIRYCSATPASGLARECACARPGDRKTSYEESHIGRLVVVYRQSICRIPAAWTKLTAYVRPKPPGQACSRCG